MGKYDKSIALWDDIFSQEAPIFPKYRTSGNAAFDRGLQWLTEDAETVLDFGCGNGILLFLCSLYGTSAHTGIDLSPAAIRSATEEWDTFLGARFRIAHFEEIYYEEHEQYNRLYLLINE